MTTDSKRPDMLSLEARFFADATPDAWVKFLGDVGLDADRTEDELPYLAFYAFPDSLAAGDWYIHCDVHPTGPKAASKGNTHWHIKWVRAPELAPPDELVAVSDKLGGYPQVLNRFSEHWLATAPPTLEISAKFEGTSGGLVTRLQKPDSIYGEVESGESILNLLTASFSWAVEPPQGTIHGLTILFAEADKGPETISLAARCSLPLNENLYSELEDRLWTDLKTLLNS